MSKALVYFSHRLSSISGYIFQVLFLTCHFLLSNAFCWGWQLIGRSFSGSGRQKWYIRCPLWVGIKFISATDALSDYCCSKIFHYYYQNRVCGENSGMTVRLSIALSIPILTAVVSVVSDSAAFYSVLLQTAPFHFVSFRTAFNFCELLSATPSHWLSFFSFLRLSLLLGQK